MNRKVILGCAVVVVGIIVLVVIGVIFWVPGLVRKGTGWVSTQMTEANRRTAIEAAWRAPSAAPNAIWFPAAVGTWALATHEDIAGLPELQLDRAGRRGKYRGEKQDVSVMIVSANDLEREALFNRAKRALETGGGSRMTSQTPGRLYVRIDRDKHTRLWWLKDWLFIFRTDGPEDPDAFAEKYLEAMTPPSLEAR